MFIQLDKIIYHSLKKSGIKDKIDETQIIDIAAEVIASIVGQSVLTKIKPLRIEQKTLYLACLTDLVAARCKQFEKKIIWELNLPFHRPVVAKIVVKA